MVQLREESFWGLKSFLPHDNFSLISWLSWDRKCKIGKQRISANTVESPESAWFLKTTSLIVLWLETQKLKHFGKADSDLLRLNMNGILKNRSYLSSIIYGNEKQNEFWNKDLFLEFANNWGYINICDGWGKELALVCGGFLGLALKVSCPGNPLSSGKTRTVGHPRKG